MKQPTQIVAKVDYIGRGAVVTVPQSIQGWHAGCLREQLLWLLNERISDLVIDFSPTLSCASEMCEVLERIHTRTQARGVGLSLVLPADSPAAEVLEDSGLPRLLRTYDERAEAEGALADAAASPPAAGGGRAPDQVPPPRKNGPVAQAG